MDSVKTEKITIWGVVQGVGFRPFAAKLADAFGMKGEIRNRCGLVEIMVTDRPQRIGKFLDALRRGKPAPAEIVRIDREAVARRDFEGFLILESGESGEPPLMLPADLAVCDDCLAEMDDPENPRYMHPFISCVACGPRYTIMDDVPYDRGNTSMADFDMCPFCAEEYADRENRRYHAQTVSCHRCGPVAVFEENGNFSGGSGVSPEAPLLSDRERDAVAPLLPAVREIAKGGVVALKGAGGYYFVCSPFLEEAALRLREIKARDKKPFAVMFPDLETVKVFCCAGPEEETLLTSGARPIVLLERRPASAPPAARVADEKRRPAKYGRPISPETCGNSRCIGAFLPGMGLQRILTAYLGPLIMTSANLSGLPMIKDDDEMRRALKRQPLLSGMLYNERKIRARADDSVVRVVAGRTQMIRRSKGYAPLPLRVNGAAALGKTDMIFAAGGQLKSAFTLTRGDMAYMSQYMGDLGETETEKNYEENLRRMEALFRIRPGLAVCDMHPLYFTTKFAEEYAKARREGGEEEGLPLLRVQHHHAHIASVMAEHGLSGPVIGVSFDGAGYGADGKIWGGEFLLCEGARFRRVAHLEYVRMIGGDSSVKEGWKSAMCYVFAHERGYGERERGTEAESADGSESVSVDISEIIAYSSIRKRAEWELVRAALEHKVNTIESSGAGRLFDAVASLLGIHHVNRYEGECAIMLENAAEEALRRPGENRACELALEFHRGVAKLILEQCVKTRESTGVSVVALSGGVFQNKILMEESLRLLSARGFDAYRNISAPPNDGGLSLGQAYIGMRYLCEIPRRP